MTPASAVPPEQQSLLERSASSLRAMRADDDFRGIDSYLSRAHGVMIFPRLRKASFIVGGEVGNGVLLARSEEGWSPPAFYRLRAGSAGLQIGYEQSTVVLAFMSQAALNDAIDGGFTLGAGASVAAGTLGDAAAEASTRPAADIVQFVESGGVFAGASLNGASISPHEDYNFGYYGAGATPRSILFEQGDNRTGASMLQNALPAPAR